MRPVHALLLALASLLASSNADAREIWVPLDIGVGPAANMMFGPMFADKPIHTGLRISTYFAINQETMRRYGGRIPTQYRRMVASGEELRFNPLGLFIPSSLYISPPIAGTPFADTGVYGLTMKPLGLGFKLFSDGTSTVTLSAGLLLTYFFMHSTTLESPMHFLRPGLEAKLEYDINFGDVGLSVGWASMLHVPQRVGGGIFEFGPFNETLWHIGQAFVQFHFRTEVPVTL